MVKNPFVVQVTFNLTKGSDCDCISELLYILLCFIRGFTLQSLKDVGGISMAKNCHFVSHLYVVSRIIKKLINNGFIDHLEKCDLFSDFQCGFRFSRVTADSLIVVSDGFASAFNKSGYNLTGKTLWTWARSGLFVPMMEELNLLQPVQ